MSKLRWLVIASICSLVALPETSKAQVKDQPDDFIRDVLRALGGPNWNAFLHGGFTSDDRFLLQRAPNPLEGERALRSSTGFNIGGGAGVDLFLRMGARMSYTFTSGDLEYRTNNGTGSDALDIGDVGSIRSHTATLEVMRYMLPSRASITPYGSVGIQGTWWVLADKSALISSEGSGTQFGAGPLFSFGVQFRLGDHLSTRLEAMSTSSHNPFTGNKSFRTTTGTNIDEPTGINRTDFRLAGVYYFGKPKPPATPTVAHK